MRNTLIHPYPSFLRSKSLVTGAGPVQAKGRPASATPLPTAGSYLSHKCFAPTCPRPLHFGEASEGQRTSRGRPSRRSRESIATSR